MYKNTSFLSFAFLSEDESQQPVFGPHVILIRKWSFPFVLPMTFDRIEINKIQFWNISVYATNFDQFYKKNAQ